MNQRSNHRLSTDTLGLKVISIDWCLAAAVPSFYLKGYNLDSAPGEEFSHIDVCATSEVSVYPVVEQS